MSQGFLKCYYGYRNRWDELLFLGVVPFLFEKYPLSSLCVEVEDVEWMTTRSERNKAYLGEGGQYFGQLHFLQIGHYKPGILAKALKFFWGGEVLTDKETFVPYADAPIKNLLFKTASKYFARSGRNYLAKYYPDILKRNFVVLWGIGTPKKTSTKRLYRLMLSRAQAVYVREKHSLSIAEEYTAHAHLVTDFSTPVIEKFLQHGRKHTHKKPYVLINLHHSIATSESIQKIVDFCAAHPDEEKIFFPAAIQYDRDVSNANDRPLYDRLLKLIPGLVRYDWTLHSVDETLGLFAGATAGIGARLHFLYPLHLMKIPYTPLVYQEKINKLLGL